MLIPAQDKSTLKVSWQFNNLIKAIFKQQYDLFLLYARYFAV
jgi:hypothetical protein